ncbi:hypothetical protein FHR58_000048 [Xanthomonas arboricola]|nr:hypothetical protein [Xanthomonas arboricola]
MFLCWRNGEQPLPQGMFDLALVVAPPNEAEASSHPS